MVNITNLKTWLVISIFLVVSVLQAAVGRTIYVTTTGHNFRGNGSSGSPYRTIQMGIDSAVDGDTVLVADGTYTGDGNRDLDFRGKDITVRSIDPNDQNVVAATIIDCQGSIGNEHRDFYFHSGETSSAVLDGFTIKNGYKHPGAGIYCSDSGPIIKNCKITENTAEWSNGIGGGCFFSNSSAEIIDCQITFNSAIGTSPHSGNGWGGGIACEGSTLKIKNTEINNNSGTASSGGIGAGWNSNLYIDNCVISHNSSQFGGGLKFQDSNINITNSTITRNSVEFSGGGFYCIRSNIIVTNTILWGDTGGEIDGWGSSITVTYSDVQGGWTGEGNINADPLFVNTANADYHLQESSPCIDAGDNSAIPSSTVLDLDGNPRIANGTVDMGAYEGRLVQPKTAYNPNPADGAEYVSPNVELSWLPGDGAQLHIVYFGDNFDDVNNDAGGILLETTTYTPGPLELDKVYYWRVDEFDGVVIHKGDVWSFTTAPFIVVDDFESYNDLDPGDPKSNWIFNTWLDGYDDPNNGSIVGYLVWSWFYWFVHSGEQSMPFSYDNSGPANYSEATVNIDNLAIDQDWTIEGARVLSLWFRGNSDNAPELMYVALANADGPTAVAYHDNPNATQVDTWTEWRIDLQRFANQGVDLTNINTISIGFGDKNNPHDSGSGQMHFDDIRLYLPPEPEPEP